MKYINYKFNINKLAVRWEYYFMFVCGSGEKIFIIPSIELAKFGIRRGSFLIKSEAEKWFVIKGGKKEEITKYLNNYFDLKQPSGMHG